MPMDVRMPDGTIVRNVPEGTTRSQLMTRYDKFTASRQTPAAAPPTQAAMAVETPQKSTVTDPPTMSQSVAPPPVQAPQALPAPPQQEPGLMDRIAADVQSRYEMGQNIMTTPGQNPASVGLQMAGKVVFGTAGDIIGEAAKSAYKTLVPESAQEKVKGGLQKVMAVPELQPGIEAIKRGALDYVEWAKKHPEAAGNIEALVDIASFIPAGKAAGAVSKAVTKPLAMESFGKGISLPSVEKLVNEKNVMSTAANKTIESAKSGTIKSDIASKLSQDLSTVVNADNAVAAGTSPGTLAQIKNLRTQIDKGDYSVENIIDVRNELSDIRNKGGKDGISASKAIQQLDKAAKNSGIKNYEEGYKAAAQAKQYNNIIESLDRAGNNAGKLRDEMQNIINSGKIKAYPEKAQKMIRRAAAGKIVGNIAQFAVDLTKGIPLVGPIARKTVGATAGTIAKGTVGDVLNAIKGSK